ncbi:MAG: ribosome-associated ATPase/putative transporter RbbA [Candidatus Binatus sp.]
MTGTAAPLVRLRSVTHLYGRTVAIDSLDLELWAGRLVGFIGPDGVGKSTLLALISGVRKIQAGGVEVFGGDMTVARIRARLCARIAYMPQGLGKNLYPTLSVYENVDFFGRLFGQSSEERAKRIEELLASTALTQFRDRPAGKLSGGMRQKLSLCCALMPEPELLILDEPTTGVDPLSRRQFWELIERMRKRRPGLSVLVATAYMEEAERFDWLVAIEAGKVLSIGTPGEMRSRGNAESLEEAFIALLPPERRAGRRALAIPPRGPNDHEVAIEARGLTRRFGDFTAVDHVSFHIERGEIFGFIGSNGCGKTTTMKMLTGLLPLTEGEALLFGRVLDARDLETRRRVGFMSQSFSLYSELTVRQNLDLHAHLFHLPLETIATRVREVASRFGLAQFLDHLPPALPLGIRQRLSLAVAVIHDPEMLILDEPTSGVDPIARDGFWQLLIGLSRDQGVTIFLSTHFMNEAERCDRVALMHEGKVLAQGSPAELMRSRGFDRLEQAFISYMEDASVPATALYAEETSLGRRNAIRTPLQQQLFSTHRLWAYARRESVELLRDPILLIFALLAPVLLMLAIGYGISLDVEHVSYAVLDQDDSPESRTYLENFSGSRYFDEHPPIRGPADMERQLRHADVRIAIEIPPNFGRDLKSGRTPEVGVWLDGSMPFQADTAQGYVESVDEIYINDLAQHELGSSQRPVAAETETRFRFNQDFKSAVAMIPGDIMLLLILIPAMLTTLGVVREKELGSIANLYATPVTRLEFLLGKQLPYVTVALVEFASLVALAGWLFDVPLKGSATGLVVGASLYVIASTGLGLLISIFVRTQIAAIFAAAIITTIPAMQFSGWLTPVSSLIGTARWVGLAFPSSYFQHISLGTFSKGLEFRSLVPDFAGLAGFIAIFLLASLMLLDKQEV